MDVVVPDATLPPMAWMTRDAMSLEMVKDCTTREERWHAHAGDEDDRVCGCIHYYITDESTRATYISLESDGYIEDQAGG